MSSNYMRVSHGLAIAAWGPDLRAPTREIFKRGHEPPPRVLL